MAQGRDSLVVQRGAGRGRRAARDALTPANNRRTGAPEPAPAPDTDPVTS
ncbi:hypothetical protein AB0O67_37005 [Streptomyces sp. NPDC086077]